MAENEIDLSRPQNWDQRRNLTSRREFTRKDLWGPAIGAGLGAVAGGVFGAAAPGAYIGTAIGFGGARKTTQYETARAGEWRSPNTRVNLEEHVTDFTRLAATISSAGQTAYAAIGDAQVRGYAFGEVGSRKKSLWRGTERWDNPEQWGKRTEESQKIFENLLRYEAGARSAYTDSFFS